MIELDVFLPKIMPYVPGCPEPTALAAIIKAAQEFCERTRLWRDEDSFTLTPTSCNVVCAPDGADLYEIEHASIDGSPLTPISLNELNHSTPRWRELDTGQGHWITQIEHGSLVVVPRCRGNLRLSTFLRPSDDADHLPDFLSKLYSKCIADGALAEILMLPGQPFTAPDRAQFYSMRFEAKLSELTNRTIKGQQRAPTRVRANWF